MTEHFADRLFRSIEAKSTPLCVGFDPHLDLIPVTLIKKYTSRSSDLLSGCCLAVEEYLFKILDAVYDLVGVIKPQFAFFEQLGPNGMVLLAKLCHEAKNRNLIVIGDAKRSDIGSTAKAYANAYLSAHTISNQCINPPIPVDALTVNPFLGWNSIEPFLSNAHETGVFILLKTSNPTSSDIQDIETPMGTISEIIARTIHDKGLSRLGRSGYSDIGAVVGATFPNQAVKLRKLMPSTPFLIPGYGHQGGNASDAVLTLDKKGLGGVVNSSRGILFAYRSDSYRADFHQENFHHAARAACIDAITSLRDCTISEQSQH
ncbi:orotidine-5'-phosphate decarboxylase [bacterium]|nr:orotidine-5'-phosphate decarboxylase [candidate division CSSED10-310 bacterium]